MTKTIDPSVPREIAIPLREALEERYLAYALSTIMGRALPDARDGLKPVHRRILYGMQLLKLDPAATFKKCAKIVGDVMGSFHPHGDQAIYDALVRLAQDFSSRYPLVEGQGNFGNIDGDSAAAYRYTEARMTAVAQLLLQGLNEDSVDFRDNYSGETREPVVLPAALPNLLANGSQGIAVGMATSVPPHNLAELCDGALYLIANSAATPSQLMTFVKGPDFPTGAIIIDPPSAIEEIYTTGRGSLRVRARWFREEGARGAWNAVVDQIPYGVQKSRLIEKMAELFNDKKLPLVGDLRDESAEDVRIVIEPRSRTIDAAAMMESLFKLTELESRFNVNMNVLVDGVTPRVVSLSEALGQWLGHRREVLLRRSRHRLAEIERRLELLAGMIIAFLNLDEVIRIIREEDEPKDALIKKFKLTELQANYILDTRLRSLRRLEEMQLKKEQKTLQEERDGLIKLTGDERLQWKTVAGEIRDLKKKFAPDSKIGKRRTTFEAAPDVADFDLAAAMIEREPITVVVSQKGWIRALKGHGADLSNLQFKGDDAFLTSVEADTVAKILIVASNGKIYTLEANKLPGGRGHGEPIRLIAEMDEGADVVCVLAFRPGAKMLAATNDGRGFVVSQDEMIGTTRKGKLVVNVEEGVSLARLVPADGDHVAVIGQNRKLVIFALDSVPEMARGKGVRLQRYKDGGLSDIKVFALSDGLSWTDSAGRVFNIAKADLKDFIGARADAGRLVAFKGFPKNNKFG